MESIESRRNHRLASPRTCVGCWQTLPADFFIIIKSKNRPPYRASRCHECRSEYARWRNYGITRDEYTALLAAQKGVCAICGGDPGTSRGGRFHVDHDHETGEVRGLLCASCNQGLGSFRDNPDYLAAAIRYLDTTRETAA